MTENLNHRQAAARIVSIQQGLAESILGSEERKLMFVEQGELWEEFFSGVPYEQIADKLGAAAFATAP